MQVVLGGYTLVCRKEFTMGEIIGKLAFIAIVSGFMIRMLIDLKDQ